MTLKDDGRCRAIISFFHHTKCNKDGDRVHPCKDDGHTALQDLIDRNKDNISTLVTGVDKQKMCACKGKKCKGKNKLSAAKLSTADLVQELVYRRELVEAVRQVDTDELADIVKGRGIKLLLDARADDLEGELRRVTDPYRPTIETYDYKEKVEGVPHMTDRPIVKKTHAKMIHERNSYRTRSGDGAERYKLRSNSKSSYRFRSLTSGYELIIS
jgi:hypothetical protein